MSGQAREDKLAHMVYIFAVFTFVTQPIETTRLCISRHAWHVQRSSALGTILSLEISSNKMSGEVLTVQESILEVWTTEQHNLLGIFDLCWAIIGIITSWTHIANIANRDQIADTTRLGQHSWHCSCEMQPTQEFFMAQMIPLQLHKNFINEHRISYCDTSQRWSLVNLINVTSSV